MTRNRDVALVGQTYEIADGEQRALVTEAGATLRAYDVAGRPVIESFEGPETEVIGAQGQVLAPWPNRVIDGHWTWEGKDQQLWVTEPERGHALHGLVRALSWAVVAHERGRIELATRLLAHPGWPFALGIGVVYELGADGLTCRVTASNIGRETCPYGVGAHPYVAVPGGTADEATVHLRAATWLATDVRGAPVERRATAGTPFDFAEPATLGTRQVDHAFTDLSRGRGGRVEASVSAPDGRTAVVWGDRAVRWFQLFTGDTLPERWLRRAVAVEPMTCGPDALNTGEDLVDIRPGESHTMTWGVSLT